jgi:PIN domain nuclease of toxin-antitoxin system
MRFPRGERGQILILLAAWLFFSGGAASALVVYDRPVSELKKAIKRVITDPGRREVILSNISVWEAGQEQKDEKVSDAREELFKTLRRKDATRSEAEPLMAKLDATLLEMDQSFLNLRFRVKAQVTSAEWAEMVTRVNR